MAAIRPATSAPIAAAPRHLRADGRRFWRATLATFELHDPHDLGRLRIACECLDRIAEARAAIAADGAYVDGRFGLKAHPGLAVERDARIAYLRAIREIGLDNAERER